MRYISYNEVLWAFSGNATLKEASLLMGCCAATAGQLASEYGIEKRRRGSTRRATLSGRNPEEMKQLFAQSATLDEAALRLGGVTRQRAHQIRCKFGYPPMRARQKVAPIALDLLRAGEDLDDWLDVLSPLDVAEMLNAEGVNRSRILGGGLKCRRTRISARSRARAVIALRRDGWRQVDIASAVGIGQANVSRILSIS